MLSLSDLTFLFHITPVHIRDEVPETRTGDGHWRPPDNNTDFILDTANGTGWCKWTADGYVEENIHPGFTTTNNNNEDVCSIFFDSECAHFLAAQTDCSQTGSSNAFWNVGWRRLSFAHLNGGRISRISFIREFQRLGGWGSGSWMPQLLPQTYDTRETPFGTGLVGDLSLLVALAAFTCEPRRGEFIGTMSRCFRPPIWWPRVGGDNNTLPSVSKWCLLSLSLSLSKDFKKRGRRFHFKQIPNNGQRKKKKKEGNEEKKRKKHW